MLDDNITIKAVPNQITDHSFIIIMIQFENSLVKRFYLVKLLTVEIKANQVHDKNR